MVLTLPGATLNESPALTEWNNAITKWQVSPPPANQGMQQFNQAVNQWTSQQAPQPTATALPQPTPTTVVMQVADPYAPASSPAEQATKDANTWNVGFGK